MSLYDKISIISSQIYTIHIEYIIPIFCQDDVVLMIMTDPVTLGFHDNLVSFDVTPLEDH